MLPIYLPKYERKQKKTHTHTTRVRVYAREQILIFVLFSALILCITLIATLETEQLK